MSAASTLGVLPAAVISGTSGVEMRPSGRTGISVLSCGRVIDEDLQLIAGADHIAVELIR